ncbi:MAG: peroxiredoxin [Akkermansiaceae bacterium]
MKPKIGEQAPEFNVGVVGEGYAEGARISLEELRGNRVVLVFYPKDNTPGCTIQACSMRDNWEKLSPVAKVFGVSVDDVASHQKFIDKKDLPYPLLSDTSKELVAAYGVWVEKSMFGKKYMGIERSTYVIGADGKIEAILEKVNPVTHLGKLLDVLNA